MVVTQDEQDVSGGRKQGASKNEKGCAKTGKSWSSHYKSNARPSGQVTLEVASHSSLLDRSPFLFRALRSLGQDEKEQDFLSFG